MEKEEESKTPNINFVKIIKGSSSYGLSQAIGIDSLPISPPIPISTLQETFFQIHINSLTNEQRSNLSIFLVKQKNIDFQEAEKYLLENGLNIPITDCYFQNITQYQINLMRAIFKENITRTYDGNVGSDVVAETFWLSIMIISFFLGDEWRKKNMTENLFINEERMSYLKTGLNTENERYEHQSRLTLFADSLFSLQYCGGFDIKIEELHQLIPLNINVKLEDKAIELLIASMVVKRGHRVIFRKKTGIKRHDFDLEIILNNGKKIFSEIKCKRDETPININNLRRTLYTAEKQLPLDSPSAIFCRIPENWVHFSSLSKDMSKVVHNFFNKVTHVNVVVLVWEAWIRTKNNSRLSTIKYKFYYHPSPQYPLEAIDKLLTPVDILPHTKGSYLELSFGKFCDNHS